QEEPIDLAAESLGGVTTYADHFLPLTRARSGDLDIALISLAPVAADTAEAPLAPAPLPGPAGALYIVRLVNAGTEPLAGGPGRGGGQGLVSASDAAAPGARPLKRPLVDLRHRPLVLVRPEGAVAIPLNDGRWTRLAAPFEAERPFHVGPGEEVVC